MVGAALDQRVVWKFSFDAAVEKTFEMPCMADVLHFDLQRGTFCIWALVDPRLPSENRHFRIIGSGSPEFGADEVVHLGTTMVEGGRFVFHCFEVTR